MKKLLFYSDCFIFGGCELVLPNIINYPLIQNTFEIHFAYRKSKEYENGLADYFKDNAVVHLYPLNLLSNDTLFYRESLKKRQSLFFKFIKLFLILWALS